MSLEMDFDTIFAVVDSWDVLRRIPDHERLAGTRLFTHLFRKCPETKELFGFPMDLECGSEEMQQSKQFVAHATNMINMLDRALGMLGPDAELLGEILNDLGKKHARLGVQESYFPYMGEALLEMLREMLGDQFNPKVEQAWKVVYNGLSVNMVKAMNTDRAVLESWDKLKGKYTTMDGSTRGGYEEVTGVLLFEKLFSLCPETKTLFGFPVDADCETLKDSRRFKLHSKYFIQMLDKALGMVEAKKIEENMKVLGAIHADYGVKPEYFPIMGEALFFALRQTLGEDWNSNLEEAWSQLYGKLSSQMISAMKSRRSSEC